MPQFSDDSLQTLSFGHLQEVVAIDSQSDEHSDAIPSSDGQRILAELVAKRFEACGASVERDPFANVIATFPGRGAGIGAPTIALLVHLDTARGTSNPHHLNIVRAWDGSAVPYPDNAAIKVDVATYPGLAEFVGQDVVHGGGVTPFGLDDKLGLTHLLTLARVLAADPSLAHPPLLLIGRPDEEIGRMEAVEGLAVLLAARGVRSGYTVDGILPFEVNVQNFNGAHATASWQGQAFDAATLEHHCAALTVHLGGVNTHGATAFDEGHRAATRFAAEILARAGSLVVPVAFDSDAVRDCDAVLVVRLHPDGAAAFETIVADVVTPHIARGASFSIGPIGSQVLASGPAHDGVQRLFAAVSAFAESRAPAAAKGDTAVPTERDLPLWAEDSRGWQGYSHPYRARTSASGAELDVRIRDFVPADLEVRKAHIRASFSASGATVTDRDQYVNMGPRLADRRDLVDLALAAGADVGVACREQPIRGGTGVDPFLERGTAIANLGTGYFAPESEKELTSLSLMAHHVRWLVALLARLAAVRA